MLRITRVLILAGIVSLSNPQGIVKGTANALLAAEEGKAPVKEVVKANSAFAFDVFKALARDSQGENLLFSPYSLTSVLAMSLEGARGETAEEIGSVLHLPPQFCRQGEDKQLLPWRTSLLHTGVAQLEKNILTKASGESPYTLNSANALWAEKSVPLSSHFVNTIATHYRTGGVFMADFKSNYPSELERINKWVQNKTANRIKGLLSPLPLEEGRAMRLVLTNAIYFQGTWAEPFKPRNTREKPFNHADGSSHLHPIMHGYALDVVRYGAFNSDGSRFPTPLFIEDSQAAYPGDDGYAMVEIPYKGEALSMIILAPNKVTGLQALEERLNEKTMEQWLSLLVKRQAHVLLPKFKMTTAPDVMRSLRSMGVERAFTDPRLPEGADFGGLTSSNDPADQLFIAQINHKAFVEVNEEGTEAAAATSLPMPGCVAEEKEPFIPTFAADRPFLYLIRDQKSGVILFLGRVMDPGASG